MDVVLAYSSCVCVANFWINFEIGHSLLQCLFLIKGYREMHLLDIFSLCRMLIIIKVVKMAKKVHMRFSFFFLCVCNFRVGRYGLAYMRTFLSMNVAVYTQK
jgi:hypothetical protein